jgi:predicted metal-binding membrane protein
MFESSTFELLLKRDRVITFVGLAALCVLAWLYIVMGAGLGMIHGR